MWRVGYFLYDNCRRHNPSLGAVAHRNAMALPSIANTKSYTDSNFHMDSDPNAHFDLNSDTNPDGDIHPIANADCHRDTDPGANAYCCSLGHGTADAGQLHDDRRCDNLRG